MLQTTKIQCPNCGDTNWTRVGNPGQLWSLPATSPKGGLIVGPNVPVVAIMCQGCGYMALFNAIATGDAPTPDHPR